MSMANIDHYIDGRVVAGTFSRAQEVFKPATGAVTGHVALADAADMGATVTAAQVLSVLQHRVPRRVLVEMCITGEPIASTQALQYGLVNHVDDNVGAKLQWPTI